VPFAGALMVQQHDQVVLQGTWERHTKYGKQFKVSGFSFDQDLDTEAWPTTWPITRVRRHRPVKAQRIADGLRR
jgi:hypothetical protein